MSNKFVDGIDMHDVHMIYETILRQHLYYIPLNEVRTQVENVFNKGKVGGIVGAYWTRKNASMIKYDIKKEEIQKVEDFLNSSDKYDPQNAQHFASIDITAEV